MLRALARYLLPLVLIPIQDAALALAADPPRAAITDVEVVAERDAPQVCATFDGRLDRTGAVAYRDFVSVTPEARVKVSVRDRTLCVEGFVHDRFYTLAFGEGLPLADGRTLAAETTALTIPNRQPALAFRGAGYLLAPLGADGLSLRSINLDRARLRLLRIDDPATVEKAYFGRANQQMSEREAVEAVAAAAREVWADDIAIGPVKNQPALTDLPAGWLDRFTEPGVYVATAEAASSAGPIWASQWFVVSNLGLSGVLGADGLLVFARRVATAEPAPGTKLRLLAANGAELAAAVTGDDGLARFPADALRGVGDARPLAIVARDGERDLAVLEPVTANADEQERGTILPAANPVSGHIHLPRGIFRPGETIDLVLLARDAAGHAVTAPEVELSVRRPDGFVYDRILATDAGGGAFPARIALPRIAATGLWTVAARMGRDGADIASATFQVEDFVAPRFAVSIAADRPAINRDGELAVSVTAARAGDAPGALLPGEMSATVRPARVPFPKLAEYRFGLSQETLEERRRDLPGFTTDAAGRATVPLRIDGLPDSSHALEAVVRAAIIDHGGRRVESELVLPISPRRLSIGIRPRFGGDALPDGATAGFDVVAVDETGAPIEGVELAYDLIEEEANYQWYEADGRWDYRQEIKDRRLAGGTLTARADPPARVEEPVTAGRFRLEVFDRASGAASSLRFAAGWWLGPTEPVKPDTVDVAVMLPSYKAGETAQVYVQPPYRSQVLIAVVDREVRRALTREIGPEGAFLEIPVDGAWTAGVRVVAIAFAKPDPLRPNDRSNSGRRAVGESWLAVAPAGRTLDVAVTAPERVASGETVPIEVSVGGIAPGGHAYVTLAAVDEVIQRLTGFTPADPVSEVFGPRPSEVEVRDILGPLMRRLPPTTAVGRPGSLPGGPAVSRRSPVVSLFSGILPVDEAGKAKVMLPIPEFSGRLRVTAIAWTDDQVGRGESWLPVGDAATAADIFAPSSLIVGDEAAAMLIVEPAANVRDPVRVTAHASGAVELAEGEAIETVLDPSGRQTILARLAARQTGSGRVTFDLTGTDGRTQRRAHAITVNPAKPAAIRWQTATLARGGGPITPSAELTEGMIADRTAIYLSAGTGAGFDLPGLLSAAADSPLAGTEAAAGRLLTWLSAGKTGVRLGLWSDAALTANLSLTLDTLLSQQRTDGSFAAFSSTGDTDGWLTAFAVDVLDRARSAGVRVPDPPYRAGVEALRRSLDNTWLPQADLPTRAYALYVLARTRMIDSDPVTHFREAFWDTLPTDLARAHVLAAAALLGDDAAPQGFTALKGVRMVIPGLADHGTVLRDEAALLALMAEHGAPAEALSAATAAAIRDRAASATVSEQARGWLLLASRRLGERSGPTRLRIAGTEVERPAPFVERLPAGAAAIAAAGDSEIPALLTAVGFERAPPIPVQQGMEVAAGLFDMDGRPADPATVRLNTTYVVVLEGRITDDAGPARVMLSHTLPAGFEIDSLRHGRSGTVSGLSWIGPLSQVRWWRTRNERLDAVIELSAITPAFRLACVVRAVHPGQFTAPGTKLTDLDRPGRIAVKPGASARIVGQN